MEGSVQRRLQFQRPVLEIPKFQPELGLSPRSTLCFPVSPKSPSPPFPQKDWESEVSNVQSYSCKKNKFYIGQSVLVKCNQSKWVLGQIRGSSRTGVSVWVNSARILVHVPFLLLPSHMMKLDAPSSPSCLPSTHSLSSLELGAHGQLLIPFDCVRPAHLSHRHLYRNINKGVKTENTNMESYGIEGVMAKLASSKSTETLINETTASDSLKQAGGTCPRMSHHRAAHPSPSCWLTVIDKGKRIRD